MPRGRRKKNKIEEQEILQPVSEQKQPTWVYAYLLDTKKETFEETVRDIEGFGLISETIQPVNLMLDCQCRVRLKDLEDLLKLYSGSRIRKYRFGGNWNHYDLILENGTKYMFATDGIVQAIWEICSQSNEILQKGDAGEIETNNL